MDFQLRGKIIFKDIVYDNYVLIKQIEKIKAKLNGLELLQGEVIGLLLSRTPFFISTIFALLDYEIPFLLLDSSQPIDRIKYMAENLEIKYILVSDQLDFDFKNTKVVNINSLNEISYRKNEFKTEIAYILYTSGSTGLPKAVEVTRKGLANFVYSIPLFINFCKGQSILCNTSSTFDIFFLESVLALHQGLCVFLSAEDERTNPRKIGDLIKNNSIDIIQMTPSYMKLLYINDEELGCLSSVKTILVGIMEVAKKAKMDEKKAQRIADEIREIVYRDLKEYL